MAYATRGQVLARAGRLQNAWTDTSQPSLTDLDGFLADVSAEIDAVVKGLGFPVPLTDPVATAAIADPVAYGALLRALDGTFPAGSGQPNQEVASLRATAQKAWDAALEALTNGTATLVLYLESLTSAPGSTDFWTENPSYGEPGSSFTDPLQTNPYLAPTTARTDRF